MPEQLDIECMDEVVENPYSEELYYYLSHYQKCRDNGCSHKLADMLASGQPPMSNTDREFLEGRGGCFDQFKDNPWAGDYYLQVAKQANFNVTGKVYMAGLARYPGDLQAWVSGRGDVRRVMEEHGWGGEGSVNLPVTNIAEPTQIGLDPRIVEQEMQKILEKHPEPRGVNRAELAQQLYDKHKPHWVK